MTNLEILKAVQEALNPLRNGLAVCLPLFFLLPLLFLQEQLRGSRDNEPQGHQETLQARLQEELLEEFRGELLAKYPGDHLEALRDGVLEILGRDPREWGEAQEEFLEFARKAKLGGDPREEFLEELSEGVQRLREKFLERQKELLELQKLQKWNWLLGPLLKHSWGQVWPVLAAILPLGLGFVSVWGVSLPISSRAVMVSLFLLAVGGIQVYGQCRSYRERAETRIEKARAERRTRDAEGRAGLGRVRAESKILDLRSQINEIGGGLSALANASKGTQNDLNALANTIRDMQSELNAIANEIRNTERRGRIERIKAKRERIERENRLINLYAEVQAGIQNSIEDLASEED